MESNLKRNYQNMGTKLYQFSAYFIIELVLAFIIGVIFAIQINSIIYSVTTVEEFLSRLITSLKSLLTILLILSAIQLIFLSRFVISLQPFTVQPYKSLKMNKVFYVFLILLIFQVLRFGAGVYFIQILVERLEMVSQTSATLSEFEQAVASLSLQSRFISIADIVISLFLFIAANIFKDSASMSLFQFDVDPQQSNQILSGLGQGRWGAGLMTLGGLISLGIGIGGIISLIGQIVLGVGYYKAGRNFQNLDLKFESTSFESRYLEPVTKTRPIHCVNCGKQLDPKNRFCESCGTKVEFQV